jgi:hypothetical protein
VSGGAISAAGQPQRLRLLEPTFAICHAPVDEPLSLADVEGEFVAFARTTEELTIVCPEAAVPAGIHAENDWRALIIDAAFELSSAVGVLNALTAPLAAAGIAIFAFSTWRTDLILVRQDRLDEAVAALRHAGHTVLD